MSGQSTFVSALCLTNQCLVVRSLCMTSCNNRRCFCFDLENQPCGIMDHVSTPGLNVKE